MRYVIVPGIDNSDDAHWQSRWQADWGSAASRIQVGSWTEPDLPDWQQALDDAVSATGDEPVVLVAHSLGCLAATSWAITRARSTATASQARRLNGLVSEPTTVGLFLVAPPDPLANSFPATARTFVTEPAALPVPGFVVCSDDDPYSPRTATDRMSRGWQVPHVSVGAAGHLNTASDLGDWNTGRNLLTAFLAGLLGERARHLRRRSGD
jgi:predicted alpha/beta hydrolase family esterase